MDLLLNATPQGTSGSSTTAPATDYDVLARSISQVTEMLDRVLTYVQQVIAGERKGDPTIGRYLLDTFATSTESLDQGSFASSLQVSFTTDSIKRCGITGDSIFIEIWVLHDNELGGRICIFFIKLWHFDRWNVDASFLCRTL